MRTRARALKLARKGLSHREIGRQLAVNYKTIEKWLSPEYAALLDERAYARRLARERRRKAARRKAQRHAETYVPVDGLREAVQRSLTPRSDICRELGWVRTRESASGTLTILDVRRLARCLGEIPFGGDKNRHITKRTVRADTALAIVRAINLDPVDIGI